MTYLIIFIKLLYYICEDLIVSIFSKLKKTILIVAVLIGGYSFFYFGDASTETSDGTLIQIPPNASFSKVLSILNQNDLVESNFLFKQFSKYLGYDRKIRSGEYNIPRNLNSYQLSKYLKDASPKLRKLTIIEGLKYSKMVPTLSTSLELDSLVLSTLFSDSIFLAKNKISAKTIEGYLLPQTYHLSWGRDERSILNFLITNTKSILKKYQKEIADRGLTFHKILTMASIIQGECIYEDEMATVSSVYWNRIRIGMKLGADPTIQYFLDKPTRLRFRHLRIDHPYNTYKYEGLPPGPINNPGEAAIKAAIFPEKTEYLYFVADGTGKHLFGKTYAEHNENRKTLDQLRRKLWREKRYGKKK